MARPIRINVAGGWYHVISRGTERRVIYEENPEYAHFLDLLGEMCGRFRLRIHAYVLMPNHYHLLIETPEANLSPAMQWLKTSYGMWYNRRHGRVGPLFQGRFKAGLELCLSSSANSLVWSSSSYLTVPIVASPGSFLERGVMLHEYCRITSTLFYVP